MTETINLEEIKSKIIEKLQPSGWAHLLRGFLQSSDFDSILKKLHDQKTEGKRFTPPLKHVFKAFEECPMKDLKVIMVGQDPYPYINVADGLAFSCSITGRPQPSLRFMFDEINKTLYNDEKIEHNPDLKRWANQGVLLLNSALTCQIDKVGSHYDIWSGFIPYLIDMLNFTDSGLIFILLGNKAQELESIIGPNHYVLKASHPASAAHNGTGIWDSKNIFVQANNILERNNGESFKIKW